MFLFSSFLQHICLEARVEEVEDVVPRLQRLTQLYDNYSNLERFAREVLTLVDQPGALRPPEYPVTGKYPQSTTPPPVQQQQPSTARSPRTSPSTVHASATVTRVGGHEMWCEQAWNHVIPTLKYWMQELAKLQVSQTSVDLKS